MRHSDSYFGYVTRSIFANYARLGYIFSFLPQKHKEPESHNVENAGCGASTFLPERLLEEAMAVNSLARELLGGKAGVGYGILREG